MKQTDVRRVGMMHAERCGIGWDLDNRWFLCSILIPNLRLSDGDKQVLRWAYGCDGGKSWELESDGETAVADAFLDGVIKDPAGVVHDYINRVPGHKTPDGKVWTAWQANAVYRRVKKALGMGFRHRWRRWLGLTISHWAGLTIPLLRSWWR